MFSFLTNLLSIPFNWFTKIVFLLIIIALWELPIFAGGASIASESVKLQVITNYWMNLTLYRFMAESTITAIEQLFIFFLTFKLMFWIADTSKVKPPQGTAGNLRSEGKGGFTSRKV